KDPAKPLPVLHRQTGNSISSAAAIRKRPSARHSSWGKKLLGYGQIYAAGRRSAACYLPSRALSRQGSTGTGHSSRRLDRNTDSHSAVGLELASRLPLRRSRAVAEGHHHLDALCLRQL